VSLSFPTSPTTGQIYQGWQWSGSAWVMLPNQGGAVINQRVFTANGTYSPSTGMITCMVELLGGGGGGGSGGGAGTNGTASTFSTLTAGGGVGGGASGSVSGGAGGTASGGDYNIAGGGGMGGGSPTGTFGPVQGSGGISFFGGPGAGIGGGSTANNSPANSGAGGNGGSGTSAVSSYAPGGGGAGGYCRKLFTAAAIGTSQAVVIGGGGAGGVASGNWTAAGNGGSGICIITEYGAVPAGSPATAVSGQRLLLSSQTVSSPVASVNFTNAGSGNGFSNTAYDSIELEIIGMQVSAATAPWVRVSYDGGSTFDSTANYTTIYYAATSASGAPGGGNLTAFALFGTLAVSSGGTINAALACEFKLWRPWTTATWRNARWKSGGATSTPAGYYLDGVGAVPISNATVQAITGLQVLLSAAGNITAGTFKLYGVQA